MNTGWGTSAFALPVGVAPAGTAVNYVPPDSPDPQSGPAAAPVASPPGIKCCTSYAGGRCALAVRRHVDAHSHAVRKDGAWLSCRPGQQADGC